MLKTVGEILAMLREQEAALATASEERAQRDDAIVKVIRDEGGEFQEQLGIMASNVRLAIRKIEGTTEEVTHG